MMPENNNKLNISAFPFKYENGLDLKKLIRNIRSFLKIDDLSKLNEDQLISIENKKIQDSNFKLTAENFNSLSINMDQVIKHRSLFILRNTFMDKFSNLCDDVKTIPKSELKKLVNNENCTYNEQDCKFSSLTICDETTKLINFFTKNSDTKNGSLFLGCVLDDSVLPYDDTKNCIYGISILTKSLKNAKSIHSLIINNEFKTDDDKSHIIKEIYNLLSTLKCLDNGLNFVNPYFLLFDKSDKKIYIDALNLINSPGSFDSFNYKSPEEKKDEYSKVWHFGILVYKILTGKDVFQDKSSYEKYIKKESSLKLEVPERIKSIIENCLSIDPNNRKSLQECKRLIDNPQDRISDTRFNKKEQNKETENNKSNVSFKDTRFNSLSNDKSKYKDKSVFFSNKDLFLIKKSEEEVDFSVGKIVKSIDRSNANRYLYSNTWQALNFKTESDQLSRIHDLDKNNNKLLPLRKEVSNNTNPTKPTPRITCSRAYDFTIFGGYSDGKLFKIYLESNNPTRLDNDYNDSHIGEVTSIVWNGKKNMLYTSGLDGKIKIFEDKSKEEEYSPGQDAITCLELNQEDCQLYAASYQVFYIFDISLVESNPIVSIPERHKQSYIVSLSFIRSKKLIITGDTLGKICFWKIGEDDDYNIEIQLFKELVRPNQYIIQTIYLENRNMILINSRKSKNNENKTEYLEFDDECNIKSLKNNFLNWDGIDSNYICNYINFDEKEKELIFCFAECNKGEGGKIVFYELSNN